MHVLFLKLQELTICYKSASLVANLKSISILKNAPYLFQVKVLYVRNLKSDVTEEQLKEKFEPYGKIERVKKIKDYGFIHFEDRDDAVKAMEELNGTVISF